MSQPPLAPEALAFGDRAAEYERGRPSYAPAAIDALAEALGWTPGVPVLDVGAGTGKLSRQIAGRGVPVIAVEPVDGMRAQIPPRDDLTVVAGSAEAIPLPDAACGSAVAGTAFHWFANATALREIRRVTQAPHRFGIVWNDRDSSVDWVQAFDAIVAPHRTSDQRYRSGAWQPALRDFGVTVGEPRRFANPQSMTRAAVVDRGLSTSFIAALPDDTRNEVEHALTELAAALPERLQFPYLTDVYVVELAAG